MSPNEEPKKPDNMELLKQQATACGSECGCHASSGNGKLRWVVGAIILLAAAAMVARAVIKTSGTSACAPAFAVPGAAAKATTPSGPGDQTAETSVGKTLGAISELNSVATNTDAVFIFMPAKESTSAKAPSAQMRSAVRTIESKTGIKCGLFTLKAGSTDYDAIAPQMTVPGVLAMVKGGSLVPVSGDITEEKLVQGFVAASRGGGCGPGGCGPSGCK